MKPVPITRAEVEHLATLAALSLHDDESERMAQQLATIVAYVQELSAVDTSEVAGQVESAAGASTGWRDDAVTPSLTAEALLAAAPRATAGGFAVPGFVSATAAPHPARRDR